jgi:hypothetical protein
MKLFRENQPVEFAARLKDIEAEEQKKRDQEIGRHCRGLPGIAIGGNERMFSIYNSVMDVESVRLGFKCDLGRSIGGSRTYSLDLVSDWVLCLTPEPLVWYPGKLEGRVCILLTLQRRGSKNPVNDRRFDRCIIVEYSELIRYFDFLYRLFRTSGELETIILARMQLLSLVITRIEKDLTSVLSEDSLVAVDRHTRLGRSK